jgi:hypothetical protein
MAKTTNLYVRLELGLKDQSERCCFEIELATVYCNLAVKGWEELTRKKAVKL